MHTPILGEELFEPFSRGLSWRGALGPFPGRGMQLSQNDGQTRPSTHASGQGKPLAMASQVRIVPMVLSVVLLGGHTL